MNPEEVQDSPLDGPKGASPQKAPTDLAPAEQSPVLADSLGGGAHIPPDESRLLDDGKNSVRSDRHATCLYGLCQKTAIQRLDDPKHKTPDYRCAKHIVNVTRL